MKFFVPNVALIRSGADTVPTPLPMPYSIAIRYIICILRPSIRHRKPPPIRPNAAIAPFMVPNLSFIHPNMSLPNMPTKEYMDTISAAACGPYKSDMQGLICLSGAEQIIPSKSIPSICT